MQASPLDLPTPPPGPSAAVPALRARAERRMSEQPASAPSPLGHADLHRLLHELQLSQIELEMQNEDLRRIQPELLLARMVFAHCDDGIAVCSPDGRIIDSNPACSRITGHTQAELLGRDARWLAGAATDAAQADARWRCLLSQDHWRGEVQQRRKDGTVFTQRLAIVTVRDDLGDVLHQVAVLSDISQQKQHEAELARIALYDPLTGVPNRRLFADRLDAAMARARRSGRPLAICYLDLDGFKAVNDELGHQAGDQLLVAVTRQLAATLRGEDTVARIGGDEFVLLIELQDEAHCELALARVLEAVRQPVELAGRVVHVSASAGVTLYPQDDADADTLLRHADQAMYSAKELGRQRAERFDLHQAREALQRQQQQLRLARALAADEFVLHFQPQVDLRQGQVVGVEALIRWQHPESGLLPPAAFLGFIEDSSLVVPVGEWVIEQVLRQLGAWDVQGLHLEGSANISPRHLLDPGFAERLGRLLARYPQVAPARLELEILESAALSDIAAAAQTLHTCRALGVRIGLDDFGTGYSSLALLRQLPLDTLKIDQAFVRDMLDHRQDRALVEGIVRLADTFGCAVVAEGVETMQHGGALLGLGCQVVQGYGVARPMPAGALPDWIRHWQEARVWRGIAPRPDAPGAEPAAGSSLPATSAR